MIKSSAQVVIIGGGIMGAAIAYNLARKHCREVVLVEKNYLTSGATGRCGAGIRQQWGTEMNCLLSQKSVKIFENLPEELDYPAVLIAFKQKGYLFLIYTGTEMELFKRNVALQNRLGIPSRLVSPREAKDLVNHLNTEKLLGGAYCPSDGHANPFHVTQAYAKAAKRLGVNVFTNTGVTGILKDRGRVAGVATERGVIKCETVVNCAGGHAGIIAAMAGISLPVYPERRQVMVSEPVDRIQDPMVISLTHHLYIQQQPHGPFIMGMGDPNEPRSFNIKSGWRFVVETARAVCTVLPPLKDLRIVRQWAGLYDMSPDAQPVLGESPEVKGFYTAAGFSGHGFMIAPYTAKLMAQSVLGEKPEMDIAMLNYHRFASGELVLEPAVV